VIDATSGNVLKTAGDPAAEYRDVLTSPDGTAIYLSTNLWSAAVAVIDPATGSLKKSIQLPSGSYVFNHMTVSPKGRYLYLTYDDRTLVYDLVDKKVLGKVDYAGDGAVVCAPDGSDVYVASKSLGIVVPISATTRKPAYQRAISVASPGDMAISPDGKRLYVVETAENVLIVADTATGAIADRVDLASPNFPSSLHSDNNSVIVSPNGSRVYVSNPAYGTVWVIDAANDYIIKSIKVGNGPEGMAVRYADDRTYKGSPESPYVSPSTSIQATTGYVIPALKQLQVEDTPIALQSNMVRTGDGSNISRLTTNGYMLIPASAGGIAYYNVTTGSASGDTAPVRSIKLEIGKQIPIQAEGVTIMAEAAMNTVPMDSSIDLMVLPLESVDLGPVGEALNRSGFRLSGGVMAAVEVDKTGLENGRDIGSATLTFQLPKPAGFDPAARYCVVRFDGGASEVLDARYLGEGANETVSFEAVSPHGFSTFTLVMTSAPAASATPRATASGGSGDGLWGILVVMAALGLGFVARHGRRSGR
jgi:YVTN family beta-propeller protein